MKTIGALSILLVMTSSALADCKSEFLTLNRVKLEAGPFRQKQQIQTFEEENGKKYPKSDISRTSDFVPPESVHLRHPEGEEISIGKDGWVRMDGESWQPVSESEMKAEIDAGLFKNYFLTTPELTDVVCDGESTYNGRKVRSYHYTISGLDVTAHFDVETKRPVAGLYDEADFHRRTDIVFEFDRSIAIKRPE